MRFITSQRYESKNWSSCINDSRTRKAAFVLLEIGKHKPLLDKILGEHKWNEILVHPSEDEAKSFSQVFPCALTTASNVKKDGQSSTTQPAIQIIHLALADRVALCGHRSRMVR